MSVCEPGDPVFLCFQVIHSAQPQTPEYSIEKKVPNGAGRTILASSICYLSELDVYTPSFEVARAEGRCPGLVCSGLRWSLWSNSIAIRPRRFLHNRQNYHTPSCNISLPGVLSLLQPSAGCMSTSAQGKERSGEAWPKELRGFQSRQAGGVEGGGYLDRLAR
ncbi:hypothetical protein BDQ17DRAFT_518836 [Cyathus striatus]|nr:hypothetical protein BDQ17DRAFT_518836 [Cyathus striatus]